MMPQAHQYLRDKFEDDSTAWEILDGNFSDCAGLIYPKVAGYMPTNEENDALDYLFLEWDYGYSPVEPPTKERKA